MSGLPAHPDPREFALQLAVVAERLDERSARAVERLESTSVEFRRELAAAAAALGAERRQAASAQAAAAGSRMRLLWIASGALLAGAMVAVAGATFAVASAQRELASISRDQALLQAINAADLTLCGDRVCARVDAGQSGVGKDGEYRVVTAR